MASIAAGLVAVYAATVLVRRVRIRARTSPPMGRVWSRSWSSAARFGGAVHGRPGRRAPRRALVPVRHPDRQHQRRGAARLRHRAHAQPPGGLLVGTAFVGAYTTFSTWMLETQRLTEERQIPPALANLVVSVVPGVAAAVAGQSIAGLLPGDAYLKLTAYFGERQRTGKRFVAEAMLDLFAERQVATSVCCAVSPVSG